MKILYVLPDGIDLGGIITVTEQYLAGMLDLGHDVTFVRLTFNATNAPSDIANRKDFPKSEWSIGIGTGLPVHPVLGWAGPQIGLRSKNGMSYFLDLVSQHDVVIWGALYGLNCRANSGVDVLRLFTDHSTRQITILHDDHLWERQAWIPALPNLTGIACVHHCSFHAAEGIPQNRALIFNAHYTENVERVVAKRRRPSYFSIQTAKPWKRVDRFVGAARHMHHKMTLAGEGIELRYMRSVDKCKPMYHHPDGSRIWDTAIAQPHFSFIGPVSEARRDQELDRHKFLCDFSSRKNTGQFNRVFVEAIKRGVVTIANKRFMSGYRNESESFLMAGRNFVHIDSDVRFHEIAAQLNDIALQTVDSRYQDIVDANYELLKLFDRKLIAQQLVDLALGKRTGYEWAAGSENKDIMNVARDTLKRTFK